MGDLRNDSTRHSDPALVSVVTPFFNTAEHLPECIESVLAQTWERLEYILVDNKSTDGSADIARHYSARDTRIRVVDADHHRPQIANYNYALSQISSDAAYCKMVQADDWIFPECIERMVEVAERSPRVGLVSSYYMTGDHIEGVGLPLERTVFTGPEVARRQLREGGFYFGSPTCVLYRASIVRERIPFYGEGHLHEDTQTAYELLRQWDFGFVHQLLAFQRVDPASISGTVSRLHPHGLDKLLVILEQGPHFLAPDEYETCLTDHLRRYARSYVRGALGPNRTEFLRYHRAALEQAGYRIPRRALLRAFGIEALNILGNPAHATTRLLERLGASRRAS